ncbi:MAG: J domain-containing protein [Actinomycetota bacterium]|nr:J domain-containing protein [Actinomycetota bacterium]
MAAAGYGGPDPDLYQLLGVYREASREEIAQGWRRRARAEHPDARPHDAAAPGRFRVLAQAYQVLGDPARRAAYDRARRSGAAGPDGAVPDAAGPDAEVPVVRVRPPQPAGPGARPDRPPLWVSPVRVEGSARAPAGWDEEQARLALWYLAGERYRPW